MRLERQATRSMPEAAAILPWEGDPMKTSAKVAVVAALGAGLCVGTAQAQDMHRDFDAISAARGSEGDGVRVRLSLPFGEARADPRDTRLSLGFTQRDGEGGMRSFDVASLSLSGGQAHLDTPLALGAAGDAQTWYARPGNLILLGVGVGVAYLIYDNNNDDEGDDNNAPPPPS